MAKVIPLFSGRPPVGLERSEPLDDLRCRLLIKKPPSEPSMISSMPWCFACWRVSLLKRFIVSNAHTTYGAFFLYVALFAAARCDLASARL